MNRLQLHFMEWFENDYRGGEYVAILGGGTIGMFTMQWAKIFGSKKVVVFDISDEEESALAKKLGADVVVNTTKENYMEEAMKITGEKGYGRHYSRQRGRCRQCIWHLSLLEIRHMYIFIGTPHLDLLFTPKCGRT